MTGTRCDNLLENTTLLVDSGDTLVLNCTCFCANESLWEGPYGSEAMPNESVLMAYSNGLQMNPDLTLTNIAIYGDYTRGMCHLQIKNFSTFNDGIYQCIFVLSGTINIQRYNVFKKSKLVIIAYC